MVKKTKEKSRRFVILCMVILIMVSSFGVNAFADTSSTKAIHKKTISIVFDNSGSMYWEKKDGWKTEWSRATYAVEVFASMMNVGDTLKVYPMNPIDVNGETFTMEKPLVVKGGESAKDIQSIITEDINGDTPIESIECAYQGLLNAKDSLSEKWLIVLTDGKTFYENGKELNSKDTVTKLSEQLTEYGKTVNLLYLGIGKDSAMPEITGVSDFQNESAVARESKDVLNKLTEMCNLIFGRDSLSVGKANTLDFDIPMKKLIVFVQGANISNLKLVDSNGKSIGNPDSIYSPHYSEKGLAKGTSVPDKTLQGSLVTFSDVGAGTYTVSFDGSMTNISAYYEPDVKLKCELYNDDGLLLENPEDAYPGTYRLEYGLAIKNPNGEYVYTDSKLLGKTNYSITIEKNGEKLSEIKNDKNGAVNIDLVEGDLLNATIKANYLKDYQVTMTGSDIGWPEGGWTILKQRPYTLNMRIDVLQDYYQLSKISNGKPLVAKLLLNGKPLTKEDLENVELVVDSEIKTKTEKDFDSSAINIYLQPGNYKNGKYTIQAKASGIDFDGNTVSAKDSVTLKIKSYPAWLPWAILALAILLLLLLIWFILSRKTLPKKVILEKNRSKYKYKGKLLNDKIDTQTVVLKRKRRTAGTIQIVVPMGRGNANVDIDVAPADGSTLGAKISDPNSLEMVIKSVESSKAYDITINGNKLIKTGSTWKPKNGGFPKLTSGSRVVAKIRTKDPEGRAIESSLDLGWKFK